MKGKRKTHRWKKQLDLIDDYATEVVEIGPRRSQISFSELHRELFDSSSEESNVSDLFDDTSVDPIADAQAKIHLDSLIGKHKSGALSELTDSFEGDLVDTEEEVEINSFASRGSKGFEMGGREAPKMNDKDCCSSKIGNFGKRGGAPSECNGEDNAAISKKKVEYIHVQHPLNTMKKPAGKPQDDRDYSRNESSGIDSISGYVANLKEDKTHFISVESPMSKHQKKASFDSSPLINNNLERGVMTFVSPDKQGLAASGSADVLNGLSENASGASKAVSELFSGESGKNLAVALLKQIVEKGGHEREGEKKPGDGEGKGYSGSISIAPGYNPILAPDVKVVDSGKGKSNCSAGRDDRYELPLYLKGKIEELDQMVSAGEGITEDVVTRVLKLQKEFCFEGLLDQASFVTARDYWREFMKSFKYGNRQIIGTHYRSVMYCFFMQNCVKINKMGEPIMVVMSDKEVDSDNRGCRANDTEEDLRRVGNEHGNRWSNFESRAGRSGEWNGENRGGQIMHNNSGYDASKNGLIILMDWLDMGTHGF